MTTAMTLCFFDLQNIPKQNTVKNGEDGQKRITRNTALSINGEVAKDGSDNSGDGGEDDDSDDSNNFCWGLSL
eukprot:CAMPEP_0195511308 /NCGR_PEP_ID=MMETSP0794_2-20130614/3677_1 /TAXON_ID=515487 /ORGANISM="Stephanopyxis turris, Strain CCMP 815" /LENGTH=72 /DNA_ID=CAMNT_0040638877 /DNA_START=65 /DNA_END=280 /DNA_ORIENTATION=-